MAEIILRARDGAPAASALVDESDVEWLAAFNWYLTPYGYAARKSGDDWRTRRTTQMHREILGLALGDPLLVDHINRIRLDNRRANLRVVDRAQHAQNLSPRTGTTSSYRGVFWNTREECWEARANLNGRAHYLGRFTSEHEAGIAAAIWRRENMTHSEEMLPC